MKRGSGFSRWMKAHPATPRLSEGERVIVAMDVNKDTLKVCPLSQRFGHDQYRCPACGMVWGVDEEQPPCQSTTSNKGNDK